MKIENPILHQIWKDRYSKNNETMEENLHRVARYCATNEKEEKDFYELMDKGLFFPAGRTISNSGIGTDLTLNNCFNSNHVPDSIDGIFDRVKLGALTHKRGGGIGYDFSLIRPNGTPTSNDAVASGVVSFMQVFNTQTATILQGGRRGANMGILNIYHPDIYEYLEAKSYDEGKLIHFNLSVMVDDKFMEAVKDDKDIFLHYPVYDEESHIITDETKWKTKKKVNAKELWDLIMTKAYNTGEYGVFFYDNLNRDNNTWYLETIVSSNPCFTGDMKLLTNKGYETFENLCDKEVEIINKNSQTSKGKVWCNGEKEICIVRFSNKKELYCTKDHKFMLINGEECEAINLKNKQVMPYLNDNIKTNKEFELYGFIQGDGDLGRLKSKSHLGLEINIGKNDYDVADYFMLDNKDRKVYLVGFKDRLIELGFSSECLPNRTLPTTIHNWNDLDKISFLRGLYSANGSVLSCGRITFKTTCKQLANELKDMLKEFNIDSYITTNKAHNTKFLNGEYMCKESYDVNIGRFEEKIKFYNTIGFLQKYKMNILKNTLIEKSPYVTSVKSTSTFRKVYDFNEPITHWGVVEGFIAHNCGEYVSGTLHGKTPIKYEIINPNEYMGACNLGSIFLHNMVDNPFTKEAKFNYNLLEDSICKAVRFLDNIIDINKFPHIAYENYQKNMRTIGLGFTGLADTLVMLNLKYGNNEAIKFTDELLNFFAKITYQSSIQLAKEKGSFKFLDREKFIESGFINKHISKDKEWINIANDIIKYGIRNARLISIAPTGTLSLTFGQNCSSGLEPIFSLEYDRKVKIGGQSDDDIQIVKMRDYAYNLWLNTPKEMNVVKKEIFVTAMDLPVKAHIDMLGVIAFHTDMSCSKTVNIPTDYSFEDTKQVYMDCWKKGIKGCTIFRPNPLRQGIFITNDENKKEDNQEQSISRGEWKDKAKDTIYYERKIYIGCGKLKLFIGWSDEEKCIQDLYVIRSGNGGCERNLQGMVIAMSGMLRLGGNIFNIEKAFEGIGACNSFTSKRVKGENISKGNSCGTAILNEIKAFLKEKDIYDYKEKNAYQLKNKDADENNTKTEQEQKYLNENGEIAYAKKFNKCPICNEELQNAGGCLTCNSCGWTKCE